MTNNKTDLSNQLIQVTVKIPWSYLRKAEDLIPILGEDFLKLGKRPSRSSILTAALVKGINVMVEDCAKMEQEK